MSELVFDVGMSNGVDTSYYLARGYKVVAIDADPKIVEEARDRFQDALIGKRLILLNYAISDRDDQEADFYISGFGRWQSSLKKEIASKGGLGVQAVRVKTKRLSSLMREYGIPFYCKIDIEGCDALALETLSDLESVPKFISVETECLGEDETLTDEEALTTLRNLYSLGYRRFKLIDQHSLTELKPGIVYYRKRTLTQRFIEILRRYHLLGPPPPNRKVIGGRVFDFPIDSSGPFGDDLEGDWLDYHEAEENLLFHRDSYMSLPHPVTDGFWCDWHAKLWYRLTLRTNVSDSSLGEGKVAVYSGSSLNSRLMLCRYS